MSDYRLPFTVDYNELNTSDAKDGSVDDATDDIVFFFDLADADSIDRIIHAVNCHDELLAALKRYKQTRAGEETPRCNCCGEDETDGCTDDCELNNTIQRAGGRG